MKKWIPLIVVLVIIIGSVALIVRAKDGPGQYDKLAECISASGAKFYGAWWCPHCAAEKADFGKSAKLLPYIECQTPQSQQNQTCNDAEIESYPTWVIPQPIVIQSNTQPQVCHLRTDPAAANDPASCKQVASQYRQIWIFPNMPYVETLQAPTIKGDVWTFPAGTRFTGEVKPPILAQYTNCPLQ